MRKPISWIASLHLSNPPPGLFCFLFVLSLFACGEKKDEKELFEVMDSEFTGLDFSNRSPVGPRRTHPGRLTDVSVGGTPGSRLPVADGHELDGVVILANAPERCLDPIIGGLVSFAGRAAPWALSGCQAEQLAQRRALLAELSFCGWARRGARAVAGRRCGRGRHP